MSTMCIVFSYGYDIIMFVLYLSTTNYGWDRFVLGGEITPFFHYMMVSQKIAQ